MITSTDVRGYVVDLPRRSDRRSVISSSLPSGPAVTYTSDWGSTFDGRDLSLANLDAAGYRLFPWQIESHNPWWRRPLKFGEIGCTLAHLACWRHAANHGNEPFVCKHSAGVWA
ncbi:MAG: glycosyltransferase family 25 protein [Nocardioidaceae bacterium]